MIKTIELLADFLISPRAAIEEIKRGDYFWTGFAALALAVVSEGAADRLLFFSDGSVTIVSFIAGSLIAFLAAFVTIVVFSAWAHFAAGLFGSQAEVKKLMAAAELSFVPLLLLPPVASIVLAWLPMPVVFYVLALLAVYCWISYLLYAAVKNVYSLSAGRTLAVLAAPILLPVLLFIAVVILVVVLLTGALS
jgi:hypothetical protein